MADTNSIRVDRDTPPPLPDAIRRGDYRHPTIVGAAGFRGWIEPNSETPAWVLFFYEDGSGILFPQRDDDGQVVGDGIKLNSSMMGAMANG